ncbi:hypothetical protein ACFVL4_15255 [Bacillus subtilis]|uniref:hypothetical protein n=1 Tax=Bacillus subtilis TaxID=1423 RepID=UPI000A33845C|nr:hypothetical protein [Bacillus subtilis]OTQ85410.1 hypothetical protein BG31_14880 [Bacillus subtilis subsp. subtilis]WBY39807.1 hypothetical protein PF977_10875 [Bacillus subtilis]
MRLFTQEEKEKMIRKESNKLKKILKNLDGDKFKVADGLIQEAAFMKVTLQETREVIDREGILELFEQGSQKFNREHPATKVYAAMINRYSAICKQLFELLPGGNNDKGGNASPQQSELVEFIKAGMSK